MAAVGDILRRFRFHGVPGAPALARMPVDRSRELEIELAPVFSVLEPAQRRAREVIQETSAEAAQRRAEWASHAKRLLEQARSDAVTARAEAASGLLAQAEGQRRALIIAAREEALRVSDLAARRTPTLVEEVVQRVLAMGEPVPRSGPGGASSAPASQQNEGSAS